MLSHMRTTVRLDDDLLRAAKQHALSTGRTLTSVLEDSLRHELARSESARSVQPYRLQPIESALQAGVRLDDNADLLDVLEAP